MKSDAIPFLVKWIATPTRSTSDIEYDNYALYAFEILGPSAKPAIPGLIRVIGRNSNWPTLALSYIGPDAIPALIEMLKTNQIPDSYGNWRRGERSNLAREKTVEALSYIGTNAEAALPVLLQCYLDEAKRSHARMAWALTSVGKNHPEVVVPALIYFLTNSSGFEKFEVPECLGTFGNKAQTAIPALIVASHSGDAQIEINAAVAIKQIAPETPDALAPLIHNLSNRESWLRENALYGLERLGTNGLEARDALLVRARQEQIPNIRVQVVNLLNEFYKKEEEKLPFIKECLTNENESVASAGVNALAPLAEKSQDHFDELLLLAQTHRFSQVRNIAHSDVYEVMQKHPEMFMSCLANPDVKIYLPALQYFHDLSRDSLVIYRREPEPSTNYTVYVMRVMTSGDKELLGDAVPIVVRHLDDENLEVRKLATNVLLELNPKAAKQAGVLVVPPYSFYTN